MRKCDLLLGLIFISSVFSIGLPTDDVYYLSFGFSSLILFSIHPRKNSLILVFFLLFIFISNSIINIEKGFNILSVLQFILSIILGAYIYRYTIECQAFLLKSDFYYKLIFIVLFLMLLELSGITYPLVNFYRINFLGVTPEVISNEQVRDLNMNGLFYRPNLFMKEASYAYAFVFFITSCFLSLVKNVRTLFFLFVMNIGLFYIYKSPSVFLAVTFYSVLFFIDQSKYLYRINRKFKNVISFIIVLVVLIFLISISESFLARIASVDFSDKYALNSVTIRLVAPIYFVIDVYRDYPIFGVGVSNLDYASVKYGVIGNNGFANFLVFFGIFGTVCFFYLYKIWGKINHISNKDMFIGLVFLVFLLNQLGGTSTFIVWFYFFSFMACLSYSRVREKS